MSTEENDAERLEIRLAQHRERLRSHYTKRPKFRSSLCESQANRILPYIEVALAGRDVLVSFADIPRAPQTLYRLVLDAFIWYRDYAEIPKEQKMAIALLRTKVQIQITDDGVMIEHKKAPMDGRIGRVGVCKPEIKEQLAIAATKTIAWKEDFVQWVESGAPGSIFERTGIALSADDMTYIRELSAALQWENKSTITSIWVQKPNL